MDITIRPSAAEDIPTIAAITNDSIARSPAHFATAPDDPADIAAQFHRDAHRYPWFTAHTPDGTIAGFSRAAQWKPRGAYDWTVESAVYLAESARGQGLGRRLYAVLFDELERRGFRCVLAGVTVPNPPSERLHEQMGMSIVGEFPAVGYKLGQWRTVRYYAKHFGADTPPRPFEVHGKPE